MTGIVFNAAGLLILYKTGKPAKSIMYMYSEAEMEELRKKDKRNLKWHKTGYLLIFIGIFIQILYLFV
jgi:hypothetical protein